jgi:endogenous inhibitor of DNA gyrase (YacG/DUF329 family)
MRARRLFARWATPVERPCARCGAESGYRDAISSTFFCSAVCLDRWRRGIPFDEAEARLRSADSRERARLVQQQIDELEEARVDRTLDHAERGAALAWQRLQLERARSITDRWAKPGPGLEYDDLGRKVQG